MHTTKAAGRSGRAIICFPIYEETCQAYPKSNGVQQHDMDMDMDMLLLLLLLYVVVV